MVLRLLILKHIRNWSYGVLEREVRANLVYGGFTRVGAGKTPDAKTMCRWGVAVGPEVVKQIHQRLVKLAQANGLAAGRRMRVDTTVGETNVHYPTDSSLLGDGVRVLIRTMKRIGKIAGETGAKLCDRSRSVKLRVPDIAPAARSRAKQGRERLNRSYGTLLNATSRVVGQAKRFSKEIAGGTKRARNILQQMVLEGLRHLLQDVPRALRSSGDLFGEPLRLSHHSAGRIEQLAIGSIELLPALLSSGALRPGDSQDPQLHAATAVAQLGASFADALSNPFHGADQNSHAIAQQARIGPIVDVGLHHGGVHAHSAPGRQPVGLNQLHQPLVNLRDHL